MDKVGRAAPSRAAPPDRVEMESTLHLSETDLRFVVEAVATRRNDYDQILQLVRGKEDLIEPMLEDPKLLDRLRRQRDAFARISPRLLFAVLLRQVRRDLENRGYVLEVAARGRRLPVFEAPEVVQLLSDSAILDYLVEMLCSFVRTNTHLVSWRERGIMHRRRFNDTDLDDMIYLARLVDPDVRPAYFKRIADISLFWSGVYPDHAAAPGYVPRSRLDHRRTLDDYERTGRRFYERAAREIDSAQLRPILNMLSEKFTGVRQALNSLSQQYLQNERGHLFEPPVGGTL